MAKPDDAPATAPSKHNDRAPATEDVEALIRKARTRAFAMVEATGGYFMGGDDALLFNLAAALRRERDQRTALEEALRVARLPVHTNQPQVNDRRSGA